MAQNHSNLFMAARHRLPGFLHGQIYTFPSKRWRKKRRQYLTSFMQPRRGTVMPAKEAGEEAGDHFHTISTVENPAAVTNINDEVSKDSLKDDPKVLKIINAIEFSLCHKLTALTLCGKRNVMILFGFRNG